MLLSIAFSDTRLGPNHRSFCCLIMIYYGVTKFNYKYASLLAAWLATALFRCGSFGTSSSRVATQVHYRQLLLQTFRMSKPYSCNRGGK